jgi:hypothetical protein
MPPPPTPQPPTPREDLRAHPAAAGLPEPRWRKSSFSTAQGECVEVAHAGGRILLRDSKHPSGARLTLTGGAWAAFLSGTKAGEFDLE